MVICMKWYEMETGKPLANGFFVYFYCNFQMLKGKNWMDVTYRGHFYGNQNNHIMELCKKESLI